MKSALLYFLCLAFIACRLSAVDPQVIDDVLAQTQARQEASMQSSLSDPFPSLTGIWGKQTYSNAAYWLGDQTQRETADAYMIECDQDPTLWDAKISGPSGDIESDEGNGHWEAYLFARIYLLYSSQSSYYPGRMSAAAEDAVVDMLWRWAKGRTEIGHADPATIHYYWDSENHHAQGWVSMWSAAQVFVLDPDYQNLSYNDGTPVTTMATALDEYFKAYCRDRALKGLTLEINAPTYAKYTLNTWLNLYDFATDPELKKRVGMLLDIYWADHAIEIIGGRRGGSRHRSYPHENSVTGASAADHRRMLLGDLNDPGTAKHPGAMSAVTTSWRPSRAVIGMAQDNAERGTFTYTSRRLGRKDSSPAAPEPPAVGDDDGFNAFDPDGGALLRTSWVTPEFVMGMSQVELRPKTDWVEVSSQNRWNGVIFSGDPHARIFTVPVYPDDKAYNAEWGVQNKGVMVLQRITKSTAKYGPLEQKIWFDDSLVRSETSGWIFVVAQDAYAGVYVVDGGYVWETSTDYSNDGIYADLNDQYSPIIIEVAPKSDYASFTAFRLEMISNSSAMSWDGNRLDYTSVNYDTTLTLFANESAPPRVDGVPNNMTPAKTYDSPYLQGEWAGGPVIIQYGDDRTIHGVAPFADDASTFGLWHFDALNGTQFDDDTSVTGRAAKDANINTDSTDSISVIADGKFGSAIRCAFESGDQYLMTASNWPANLGTIRYQGWFRLNSSDTGGMLFHIYDQVNVSVDTTTATFSINLSGNLGDTSATNFITISAPIDTSNDWQYIEAIYDGERIQLITEPDAVSAPGIGEFIPNNRSVYIGSRKNKSNYVGDMDEVKVSANIPTPVIVAGITNRFQNSNPDIITNTITNFAPAVGANSKLVVVASWESGTPGISSVTYAGLPFTEAVTSSNGRQSSIWYLDLDAQSPASGDVVVTFPSETDSRVGVLSLQNAAPGAPVQINSASSSDMITVNTSAYNALSVGVYTENNSGTLGSDFANTLYSGDSGSSVGNAGYETVPTPESKTFTWTTNATSGSAVAVAVFAPASLTIPEPADDDEDGLADSWEIDQLGSLGVSDGSVDTDGDRFSDFAEFNWGTSPTDGTSFFKVIDVSNTTLNWAGVQGKTYTVYKKTSLTEPTWTVEATGVPGSPETVFPVSSSDSEAFFMIELE